MKKLLMISLILAGCVSQKTLTDITKELCIISLRDKIAANKVEALCSIPQIVAPFIPTDEQTEKAMEEVEKIDGGT